MSLRNPRRRVQRVIPVALPEREVRARLRLSIDEMEFVRSFGSACGRDRFRVGVERLIRSMMASRGFVRRSNRA